MLDTARGAPAAGVAVTLYARAGEARSALAHTVTDADGRIGGPVAAEEPGTYELDFDIGAYFARSATPTFYEIVTVRFRVDDAAKHYHVPLLIAPWGYSTYRGS